MKLICIIQFGLLFWFTDISFEYFAWVLYIFKSYIIVILITFIFQESPDDELECII
jgi:hypothetical protein